MYSKNLLQWKKFSNTHVFNMLFSTPAHKTGSSLNILHRLSERGFRLNEAAHSLTESGSRLYVSDRSEHSSAEIKTSRLSAAFDDFKT